MKRIWNAIVRFFARLFGKKQSVRTTGHAAIQPEHIYINGEPHNTPGKRHYQYFNARYGRIIRCIGRLS